MSGVDSSIFTSPAPMRLRYFDCRGLAETARYMLAIGGIEYVDDRFPFTFGSPGDFSTIKRPEFDAAQAAGEFTAGMDKVPVLEVGGQTIAQSKAIERYIARRAGLAGNTDIEAGQIDAVAEHVRDIKQAYQPCRKIEDSEAREEAMRKWFEDTLPALSSKLEAALPACVCPAEPACPAQNHVNHAHVSLYCLYHGFFDNRHGAQAAIEHCPRIQAACAGVACHPAVKQWEAERPDTAF